jgi:selenocysteine lyase/cysteine desulfurase
MVVEELKALVPREDFLALKEYTYLNSASISLMPRPALQAMEEYERGILRAGTVSLDEEAEVLALDGARRAAAKLIGVSEECIAIASSATEAMSQVAWAVRPSGNVVAIDIDHPSTVYPWRRVAKETGAELRLVKAWSDPASLRLEDVAALVDDETSVVAVSHVQYATGLCLDLGRLADIAHRHGALCVIDATQSAGAVPIDAAASNVDAMVAGGYKWMCGPFGAAFFYLSPALMDRIEPVLVGWRSTTDMWRFDVRSLEYAPTMRRFEFCTMSYAAAFGLCKALEYLLAVSPQEVHRYDSALGDRLIEGLDAIGATVLSPRQASERGSIVTARFLGRDGEKVAAELNRRGVIVSPRFGATRFAPHLFNDSRDIDRALEILGEVLQSAPATVE